MGIQHDCTHLRWAKSLRELFYLVLTEYWAGLTAESPLQRLIGERTFWEVLLNKHQLKAQWFTPHSRFVQIYYFKQVVVSGNPQPNIWIQQHRGCWSPFPPPVAGGCVAVWRWSDQDHAHHFKLRLWKRNNPSMKIEVTYLLSATDALHFLLSFNQTICFHFSRLVVTIWLRSIWVLPRPRCSWLKLILCILIETDSSCSAEWSLS